MKDVDKSKYQLMMDSYPILFNQRTKSMSETCMCWGIECGEGWYKPLNELCSYLETLNKTYKKYNVRIQADQVKEKFGELRFYYSVVFVAPWYKRILAYPFYMIKELINEHVKFDYKQIIVEPAHYEERWEEISKEDFDNKKIKNAFNNFEPKFVEKPEGKYFRNYSVYHIQKVECELQNHFVLDWVRQKCHTIVNKLSHRINIKANKKQLFISDMLNSITRQLVDKCEDVCWNTCEWCGDINDFGEKNIITTSGWISRICKKCAQEKYDKDVELYDQNNPNNNYVNIPRITLFKEGYGFLNFFDAGIFEYNGVYYNSIPHALYSIKDPKHKDLYAFVRQNCKEQTAPYVISELARAFGVECSDNDYNLLKDIVLAKYTYKYDIGYKTDLLNTEDKKLINMNKYCDNLWGVCVCEKCNQSLGKNLYGQILMEIRDQLKSEGSENENS